MWQQPDRNAKQFATSVSSAIHCASWRFFQSIEGRLADTDWCATVCEHKVTMSADSSNAGAWGRVPLPIRCRPRSGTPNFRCRQARANRVQRIDCKGILDPNGAIFWWQKRNFPLPTAELHQRPRLYRALPPAVILDEPVRPTDELSGHKKQRSSVRRRTAP